MRKGVFSATRFFVTFFPEKKVNEAVVLCEQIILK